MRFLYFTDAHGTMQKPESRLDDYPVAFLKKLTEIKYACKHFNVDTVLCGGDLFHSARVSDRFAGMVAEIMKNFPETFVVPGNHDMEAYNLKTLPTTKLGLLAKAGVFTLLTRENPITIKDKDGITIAISGQEFYDNIDTGNSNDFKMFHPEQNADINILVAHAWVTPTPMNPEIRFTLIKDIQTDADIVLCGHFHQSFEVVRDDGVAFYNPGSTMRTAQTDYNKTHTPSYAIIDIYKEDGEVFYDYQTVNYLTALPSTQIFDYSKQAAIKAYKLNLDGFKTTLANSTAQVLNTPNVAIQDVVRAVCATPDIINNYGNIEPAVSASINRILAGGTVNLSAPSGYITANQRIYISKIEIHNFESHKDTVLEFCNGLNAIIGASNNGKSGIFRAIEWVTDNYHPSGANFIMNGETECWVKIYYSDGSTIKRSRTAKSSGEYEVYTPATGLLPPYKGFGSSVPLDVMNVHQMPKVNLTKDLKTHLNITGQFDSAFLVNESPIQKASSIGRITGTHIVDLAIQQESNNCTSNRSKIKNQLSEISDRQNEIKALPDIVAMETSVNSYQAIMTTVEATFIKLKEAQDLLKKRNELLANISEQESKLKSLDDVLKNKDQVQGLITVIKDTISKYETAGELDSKIKWSKSYINDLVNDMLAADEKKKYSDDIQKMSIKIENIEDAFSFNQRFSSLVVVKNELEEKHVVSVSNETMERIDSMKQKIDAICQMTLLVDSYKTITGEINKFDSLIEQCQEAIVKFKDVIKTKNEDFTNLILSSDESCPCCGGPITKENVDHVMEFYKGGLN